MTALVFVSAFWLKLKTLRRVAVYTVTAAITWWLICVAIGVSALVYGVWLLAGFGWAVILFGLSSLAAAEFIRRGMTRG